MKEKCGGVQQQRGIWSAPRSVQAGAVCSVFRGMCYSQSILAEKAASGHKSPLSQEANPLLDIRGQLSCSLFLHFSAVVRELLIGVSSQGKQAE